MLALVVMLLTPLALSQLLSMVWLALWAMQLMSLALQAPPLMLPAVVVLVKVLLLLVALARS